MPGNSSRKKKKITSFIETDVRKKMDTCFWKQKPLSKEIRSLNLERNFVLETLFFLMIAFKNPQNIN